MSEWAKIILEDSAKRNRLQFWKQNVELVLEGQITSLEVKRRIYTVVLKGGGVTRVVAVKHNNQPKFIDLGFAATSELWLSRPEIIDRARIGLAALQEKMRQQDNPFAEIERHLRV